MEEVQLTKVARGSFYLSIHRLVSIVMGTAFWIIVAKLAPPEVVGIAVIAWGVSTVALAFGSMGLEHTAAKYVSEYNSQDSPSSARTTLRLCLKLALVAGISAAALLAVLSGLISSVVYNEPSLILLILVVSISLPLQSMMLTLLGGFRGYQRMELSAISEFSYQAIRLVAVSLFLLMGLGALGIILAFVIGLGFELVLGLSMLYPRVVGKSERKIPTHGLSKRILQFTAPNYAAVVSRMMGDQIPLLILGILSFSLTAFYNIALLVSTVIIGISQAVAFSLLPTVSEAWVQGQRKSLGKLFNKVLRISLTFSGVLVAFTVVYAEQILQFITPEYVAASQALRILGFASFFSAIVLTEVATLNGLGRPRAVMWTIVMVGVASVLLSLYLVPGFGMEGAAASYLVAATIAAFTGMMLLKSDDGVRLHWNTVLKPALCIIISIAAGFLVLEFSRFVYASIITLIGSYILCALLTKALTIGEFRSLVQYLPILKSHNTQ